MTVPARSTQTPNIETLRRGLFPQRPSSSAIKEAEHAMAPAGVSQESLTRIGRLLGALYSHWPHLTAEGADISREWLVEDLTAYPLWAIEAGVREVHRTATFAPKPGEVVAAVAERADAIRKPLDLAKARLRMADRSGAAMPPPKQDSKWHGAEAAIAELRRRAGVSGDD